MGPIITIGKCVRYGTLVSLKYLSDLIKYLTTWSARYAQISSLQNHPHILLNGKAKLDNILTVKLKEL